MSTRNGVFYNFGRFHVVLIETADPSKINSWNLVNNHSKVKDPGSNGKLVSGVGGGAGDGGMGLQ